jgi:flagellar biosynthetic protein FliR
MFGNALQFALPLIGALLITNLALGILSRSAPQLNIFAVGFPITIAVGFVALMLTIPYLAPLMEYFTHTTLDMISRFLLQLGEH